MPTVPRNQQANPLRGIDRQQAGMYAPQGAPFIATAAQALTASRGYIIRFVTERRMTITKMAFLLTVAAGSNDNCDVGIFDSTLTQLLASAGSTPGKLNAAVPSIQSLNLVTPLALRQGKVYYAAFAAGPVGTTPASVGMTSISAGAALGIMFGATAGLIEQTFQNAAFPLAAPFTSGGGIGACPVLALLQ